MAAAAPISRLWAPGVAVCGLGPAPLLGGTGPGAGVLAAVAQLEPVEAAAAVEGGSGDHFGVADRLGSGALSGSGARVRVVERGEHPAPVGEPV
jgi:hypothetical protein